MDTLILSADAEASTEPVVPGAELTAEETKSLPLAARLRPKTLSEYVGQTHILGEGKLLRRAIESDRFTALIFWGPPGVGKTSLAELIARKSDCAFVRMSGVVSTVADMRKVIEEAVNRKRFKNQGTLVFIDEIHRWSRAQQDVLLPVVERGTIRLVGATTENPNFYVVGPLLSRALVFRLEPLGEPEIETLLNRGCETLSQIIGKTVRIAADAVRFIAQSCEGDGRKSLGVLEVAALTTPSGEDGNVLVDLAAAEASVQKKFVTYGDDGHYDTASAFIKSMRGSDPDAAVYWLAKMIHAGEDVRFIARRIVIFASEDVGNADPRALQIALAAMQASEMIGLPEARIILSQAVTYCATAPKSNAAYAAIDAALEDVRSERVQPVPLHLRDAHYKGASAMGHGKGYVYPHGEKNAFAVQDYMGVRKRYYAPSGIGYEEKIKERLAYWESLRGEAEA